MLEGPSCTELTLLSVFLKKNVVCFDVIFFFIVCKLVVRCFIIQAWSDVCICCSVEASGDSVNINFTGGQAGNVLVAYDFAQLLSAGGCS